MKTADSQVDFSLKPLWLIALVVSFTIGLSYQSVPTLHKDLSQELSELHLLKAPFIQSGKETVNSQWQSSSETSFTPSAFWRTQGLAVLPIAHICHWSLLPRPLLVFGKDFIHKIVFPFHSFP